jgi:hypothetical protein
VNSWAKIEPCLVELDGVVYRYDGGSLSQVLDLAGQTDGCRVFSDLGESVFRVMVVETEPRYAERVVARRLQEAGDFDEAVTVLPHCKRGLGKGATEILFTAVPSRTYHRYIDWIEESEQPKLLFPIYSVLCGLLKRCKPAGPLAIVFHHGRFADVLIANRRQIFFANRFVAFDQSPEQVTALWERIHADCVACQNESRITIQEVLVLDWVDTGGPPAWPETSEIKLTRFAGETVRYEAQEWDLSFFKAAARVAPRHAISPPLQRFFHWAGRWIPAMGAGLALAALTLFAGAGWHHHVAAQEERQVVALEQGNARLMAQLPPVTPLRNYEDAFAFVGQLARDLELPPAKQIINDLCDAAANEMALQSIDVNYQTDRVRIELIGTITTTFDKAYVDYQRFLKILGAKAYHVGESSFGTNIRSAQFKVHLEKRFS